MTMLARPLSFLFATTLLVSAAPSRAGDGSTTGAPWEVAIVFVGNGESAEFQADVDKNILELAKTEPGANLRLSIMREFDDRRTEAYFGNGRSLDVWDPLFSKVPLAGVKVPGVVRSSAVKNALFEEEKTLRDFLSKAFRQPSARRLLVIYGHGQGFRGLRGVPLLKLESKLANVLPKRRQGKPLDLLWFDSCFMASLEVFVQLQNLTSYFIASQDAEFSSGMPFDTLSELGDEGMDDPARAAVHLAYRHVESYSFIKEGSQRSSVETSSATVAVIDSEKIGNLIDPLQALSKKMKGRELVDLVRSSARSQMIDASFVDLGKWAKDMRLRERSPEGAAALKRLNDILETSRAMSVQKSPRIYLKAPRPSAVLVFGYDGWSRGFEGDEEIIARLPAPLNPQKFIAGFNGRSWPSRAVKKRLIVQPFLPGNDRFDVIWSDDKGGRIGGTEQFSRTRDFAYIAAQKDENPILFSAHTWSAGTTSDRYTGLNIADPSQGLPTMDYLETELQKKTGWANF